MADYPGAITSFATLVDYVDYVLAADMNARGDEIVAIETELGTNISGNKATLKERLAVSIDDDGLIANTMFKFAPATELTISSDAITVTQSVHKLQPQTGTTDNLSTISGTVAGNFGVLMLSDPGTDTLTIKHNVGNIYCTNEWDIVMSRQAVAWYSDGTKVYIIGGGLGVAYNDEPTFCLNGRSDFIEVTLPL